MLWCSLCRQQRYLITLLLVPAGVLVMIVLLCLTPVFRNMPQNAQAAVIIAAVIGLFRYDEWVFLWKVACPLSPVVFLRLPLHQHNLASRGHLSTVAPSPGSIIHMGRDQPACT